MKPFLDSIVPCLLGAGLVLTFIHIKKAIYGSPRTILGICGSISDADQHSKMYYRSLIPIVPTLLVLLGFVVGAGLNRFWHEASNYTGYGWVSAVLAGLAAGIGMWLSLKSERYLIRRFIHNAKQDSIRSDIAASSNR